MAADAVIGAWVTEMVAQTFFNSDQKVPPGLPVPSLYLSDCILFGALLYGAKGKAAPVVTLIAWGYVLATLLNNGSALDTLAKKVAAPFNGPPAESYGDTTGALV